MTSQYPTDFMARKAGFLYLLLVPLGIFGILIVPEAVMVQGDPDATLKALETNMSLLRWGVLTAFAIQVVQLFTAIALYDLFKQYGRRIASYMVLFTLIAMPVALINELSYITALQLLTPEGQVLFPTEQAAWSYKLLRLHSDGLMVAHVFWGLWLLPMGYLCTKADFVPNLFGWLLMIGGVAYIADTVLWMAIPDNNLSFADIMGWSEILLPIWLLVRGVKPIGAKVT